MIKTISLIAIYSLSALAWKYEGDYKHWPIEKQTPADQLNMFCSASRHQCRIMHAIHSIVDHKNIANHFALNDKMLEDENIIEKDDLLLQLPPFTNKDMEVYQCAIKKDIQERTACLEKHGMTFDEWKQSRIEKKPRKLRFVTYIQRNPKTKKTFPFPHYSYQIDDHEVQLERRFYQEEDESDYKVAQQMILFSPHLKHVQKEADERFKRQQTPETADAMAVIFHETKKLSFDIKDSKPWMFSDIEIWKAIFKTSSDYLKKPYTTFRQNCGVFAWSLNSELTDGSWGTSFASRVRMLWLKTVYKTVAPTAEQFTKCLAYMTGGVGKPEGTTISGSNVPVYVKGIHRKYKELDPIEEESE